jgi:hypothetical protein
MPWALRQQSMTLAPQLMQFPQPNPQHNQARLVHCGEHSAYGAPRPSGCT